MKRSIILMLIPALLFCNKALCQSYEKGIITDNVICAHDTAQSYALYLPSNYNSKQVWPIIYIFEPLARGSLPLTLFKQAAETYGYIIVSSNNSKNGSWALVFDAARAMKKDTEQKFNIDKKRIYTAGFSGGSRAAMATAKTIFNATGIIANAGAYLAKKGYTIKATDSIAYAAIVGYKDMNYLEHIKLDNELEHQGANSLLLITDKPHQWATSQQVLLAIKWMELITNSQLTTFKKDHILESFIHYGDSISASPNIVFNLRTLQALENNWGITFTPSTHSLLATKQFQKELKLKQKAEEKEKIQLRKYKEAFASLHNTRFNVEWDSIHTKSWWRTEIDRVSKKQLSDKKFTSLAAQRLFNYLSAGFAENSFLYEQRQEYTFALDLNEMWGYTQPKSVWAMYNKAKLLAKLNENQKAIEALYMAKNLGMKHKASLTKQPAFKNLRTNPKFISLLNSLPE